MPGRVTSAAGVCSVVEGFVFGRWTVVAPAVESAVVVPVDPFEGGVFDGVEAGPGALGPDQFLLVEPVQGFGGGVVVAVSDGADGGFDAGALQAFGVGDGEVLDAVV